MNFQIHAKEKKYFAIIVSVNIALYLLILSGLIPVRFLFTIGAYALTIALFGLCMRLILIGHIKGNGIKITPQQFPEIHEILTTQSQKLGLSFTPTMYVLQGGGMLNAFATRFPAATTLSSIQMFGCRISRRQING